MNIIINARSAEALFYRIQSATTTFELESLTAQICTVADTEQQQDELCRQVAAKQLELNDQEMIARN